MNWLRFLTLVVLALPSILCADAPKNSPQRVMTWVPPYAIEACHERLNESYDGVGMKNGLTHIGLQFWSPTEAGGIAMVNRFGVINDETVARFRDWADKNGVKLLLCVYNSTPKGWDWQLAVSAFDTHRTQFVDALMQEVLRLKLDGVDIDLEGEGELEASKPAFLKFIKELSGRLREKDKELTVDSFAYKWHAPRQSWWPELLPHVDALHVMGYTETSSKGEAWRAYDFIKKAGGEGNSSKLVIGMPSHLGEWKDCTLEENLKWLIDDRSIGLAFWDAQLKDPKWRTKATWETIKRLK